MRSGTTHGRCRVAARLDPKARAQRVSHQVAVQARAAHSVRWRVGVRRADGPPDDAEAGADDLGHVVLEQRRRRFFDLNRHFTSRRVVDADRVGHAHRIARVKVIAAKRHGRAANRLEGVVIKIVRFALFDQHARGLQNAQDVAVPLVVRAHQQEPPQGQVVPALQQRDRADIDALGDIGVVLVHQHQTLDHPVRAIPQLERRRGAVAVQHRAALGLGTHRDGRFRSPPIRWPRAVDLEQAGRV